MKYTLCIGVLHFFLFQNSIATEFKVSTFSSKDLLTLIIRFAIAGQAHSNDLTENGSYVCSDFIQYRNDTSRSIIPWITNLCSVNKLFYIITQSILEEYYKEPNQISRLVDFFCTHVQDKDKQEELPISIYLSKYLLNFDYCYCNTVFSKSMSVVVATSINNQLLQQYQEDCNAFMEENKSCIDPDACIIRFHQKQLKCDYYIYKRLFFCYPFLTENNIEFCLEKMVTSIPETKELHIRQRYEHWAFFLQQCFTRSEDHVHIPKRCEHGHSFLKKIFSYPQLINLQNTIWSDCMVNANNTLNCPAITQFIQNKCKGDYLIINDTCNISTDEPIGDVSLDPEMVKLYLNKEISFEEFTTKVSLVKSLLK